MANGQITIEKNILKKTNGVVVFALEKFQALQAELENYRKRAKLLRGLENFQELSAWSRDFAKKRKITQKQVLEND